MKYVKCILFVWESACGASSAVRAPVMVGVDWH